MIFVPDAVVKNLPMVRIERLILNKLRYKVVLNLHLR